MSDEYQASLMELRQSYERALENRAIWEGVAVLLNEDLKRELGPVEYAKRYGDSALSVLFEQVKNPPPKHLPTCVPDYGCDHECPVNR